MIRSFIRCSRVYQNLLGRRRNCILPTMNHFLSSISIPTQKHNHLNHMNSKTEESLEVPPNVEYETKLRHFVAVLQNSLKCPKAVAIELYMDHPKFVTTELTDIEMNVDLLLHKGVKANVIIDNPWMLIQDHDHLSTNLDILESMEPNNINDFAPLALVPTKKLMKLKTRAYSERDIVPNKHRIYYISKTLDIKPSIVAKCISTRLFVLIMSFDHLDQNLQIMAKYIAPMDIMNDLWALRYQPEIVEHRLSQAKLGQQKKIMPWMIRCPEEKLLRAIQITSDAKAIVGEKTLVKYLSERLKFDKETTEAILQKQPSIYSVRAKRMKEILDYLLDEAGVTADDIARTPKIFCHSLKTTKKRLEQLKSLGCRPQSLFIVCKSAKEYEKFIQNWIDVREKLKEKYIIKE